MGKIHKISIFSNGDLRYEKIKDEPSSSDKDQEATPSSRYTRSEPDHVVYSGNGCCAMNIQMRFGDKSPVSLSRDKCESREVVWAEANMQMTVAREVASRWLGLYAAVARIENGRMEDHFDTEGIHGVISVKITRHDGKITALDFESKKTGFSVHVEDPKMFAFLWGKQILVAQR